MSRATSVFFLLLFAACSGGPDSSTEPELGTFLAAADPAPAPMTTTCNAAGLTAVDAKCQGPWSYTRWKTCPGRFLDCGLECTKDFACDTFRLGVLEGSRSFPMTTTRSCDQKMKWVL